MRNNFTIASVLFFLAEYSLRGLKAWARRVTAEWLKTPCLVLSRDQSTLRYWTLPGRLWVRSNKSHERRIVRAKTLINNYEADYTGYTKTTNTEKKYGF